MVKAGTNLEIKARNQKKKKKKMKKAYCKIKTGLFQKFSEVESQQQHS